MKHPADVSCLSRREPRRKCTRVVFPLMDIGKVARRHTSQGITFVLSTSLVPRARISRNPITFPSSRDCFLSLSLSPPSWLWNIPTNFWRFSHTKTCAWLLRTFTIFSRHSSKDKVFPNCAVTLHFVGTKQLIFNALVRDSLFFIDSFTWHGKSKRLTSDTVFVLCSLIPRISYRSKVCGHLTLL